jgi:hypothetical protein
MNILLTMIKELTSINKVRIYCLKNYKFDKFKVNVPHSKTYFQPAWKKTVYWKHFPIIYL